MFRRIAELINLLRLMGVVVFGNGEKKAWHERELKNLQLDKSTREREHQQELQSLDSNINDLYKRRHFEGLTVSEVLNECDNRRGVARERHFIEVGIVENGIRYHQYMISKYKGLLCRIHDKLFPTVFISRRQIIKLHIKSLLRFRIF